MKQLIENLRSGKIEIADVPCPKPRPGHLLIQTARTLISSGTERTIVEFGQAGLIAKARAQPEKVRQVLTKIKTDGLLPTIETVFARLDEPMPLGYCNAGRVVEVGRGVEGFAVGDRVASNGRHAEVVCVPSTLAGRIPDGVDDDSASFTVLGSIALHGIRLLEPTLGERFVVVGLGLLGQIAIQLLRAHGCNVLGVDVNAARCELARSFGCQVCCAGEGADPVHAAEAFSAARGVDGVLITASTKSDAIIKQATQMCRKRGRIVLVGVIGLNLSRNDFYLKELSFRVSCSYGPGRYDSAYEDKTQDYPEAYVRWTVARNFEAVLDAIAHERLSVAPLISHRVEHANASRAYQLVLDDPEALGVVMTYPQETNALTREIVLGARTQAANASSAAADPVAGVIGAGGFAKLFLLPSIVAAGVPIESIASAGGVSALHAARKFNATKSTTDVDQILKSSTINTVFINTRHDSHVALTVAALEAGKHVYVEKPLALDEDGLERIRSARAAHPDQQLMVGFNRRFAPHTLKVKQLLKGRSQPIAIVLTVNAGAIPRDHWVHDREVGGGRIIGEGCHFIDLARHLVDADIVSVQATNCSNSAGSAGEDSTSINLAFADGSIATILYLANGPKSFPKERIEIFSEGRVLTINNFRQLISHDWNGAPSMRVRRNKGHRACVAAFVERIRGGGPLLIPFAELEQITIASIAAVRSARDGVTIQLAQRCTTDTPAAPAELSAT